MKWFWKKKVAEEEPAHLRTGAWGERLAARHLKKKGYRILGRRVRVGRRDELDLIARHKEVLVFVEVKTRASVDFGRPVTAVNRSKQAALSRAAMRYMRKLKRKPDYFRFDVVEVVGTEDSEEAQINHIENAFQLTPRYRVPW